MPEVTVNGVKISYEVRGEGPPVLFICGTLQPALSWWMFGAQQVVDAGHTAIVFDNRGVAPSEVPPPPYTVDEMASDAIGLMEHLELGPYAVIGASLGGMITQRVALRRPELVRAAVFLVSGGNVCAYARASIKANVDLLETGVELPESFLAWSMLESILPPDKLQDDDAVAGALAMAGMFGTLSRDGMLGQFAADLQWANEDHLTELEGLQMPALAIACEHDLAFPPAHVKRAVARMPQGEFVEIAGAPHVAIDKVEEISDAIRGFLATHVPVGV
jgi:pimeloyl-ACP methyl ester carboxylesterase